MHQAASLQFERVMDELVLWHAVPEDERSPAPAWWWGPAMEVRDAHEPMRHTWCCELGLGDNSSFAEGAHALLTLFAEQTSLSWPDNFPRIPEVKEDDVRELHPQPSDDRALQS
jgi:hypothetical protein